ncbi:MAG TPA: phosphatase PAP2 family protein [Longimicrobium sp.]|nr:phosphatase PAP2 family protein [Longimicrobium sp.]
MRRRISLALLAAVLAAPPADAQQRAPAFPTIVAPRLQVAQADSGGSDVGLFDSRDLYFAGGFVAATIILTPLDRALATTLRNERLQDNPFLKKTAAGARLLGVPGGLILSTGTYVGGKVTGNRDVAELGLHTATSVLTANLIIGGIKGVAGRARPYQNPENPYDFKLFAGVSDEARRSFPSGHTASAFAAAAAATTEVGYHWHDNKLLVGTALFTLAGLTGVSRIYDNKHWASDVAVGAAIGSFTGWKVTRYMQAHPNNTIDRLLIGEAEDEDGAVPDNSGGIPIIISIPTSF